MLDKKSLKLLKQLYKSSALTNGEMIKIINDEDSVEALGFEKYFKLLYEHDFIIGLRDKKTEKCLSHIITPKGRAYIEERRRRFWGIFVPILISIGGVIISIIALCQKTPPHGHCYNSQ